MRTLVTVLLTALFVFAAATTWVDYVQPKLMQKTQLTAESSNPTPDTSVVRKKARKPVPKPAADLLPVPEEKDPSPPAPLEPGPSRPAQPQPGTAAELTRRMEDVKQQETRLADREESLRMIYDDIREELAAVDEIRKKTNHELSQAESRLLETAKSGRSPRIASHRTVVPPARQKNENQVDRSEALIVRRLVEDGKVETAVSVLKSMKARDAAAVLSSLSNMDPKLADALATRVAANPGDVIRR